MSVITLTVYCFLTVFSFVIYRRISHPVFVFNLIWTILIAVSRFGFHGLSVPAASSYEVFLKGGLVFNIVCCILFFFNKFINVPNANERRPLMSDKLKQNIVLILNIVLVVYYIYKLIRVTGLIGEAGNYASVRSFYYSNENFSSSLEYNIVTYIFDPVIYLNSVIFALNTKKKHYHTYTLVLIFINMLLRTVISGGRMIIFEFAICILITQITPWRNENDLRPRPSKNPNYARLVIIIVLLALFYIASYISELRGANETSLAGKGISTVISNFTGSFSYFSVLNYYGKYYSVLYGKAMFAGIIDPIIALLHFLGLTELEITQNTVGNILSEFYNLGTHSYNAMPTMYYFFITDFREFGIIIGSVFLSLYCFIVEGFRKYFNNYKAFAFYLLMMLVLIESAMTWLPFRTSFAFANILVIFLVSNNKLSNSR